jgi:hypothetical protein
MSRKALAAQYEITSHSCNFLKGLRKTTKILSQGGRRPGRISNGYTQIHARNFSASFAERVLTKFGTLCLK